MQASTSQSRKPNEFIIPKDKAYAMTDLKTWNAIEFLMTKLEPVGVQDLNPDDRECAICQQGFRVSEYVESPHAPVKTVCGHVFGKSCIIKWLDPLSWWGPVQSAEPRDLELITYASKDTNTSCPLCRHRFFPKPPTREPMEGLAARLWLWDTVYVFVGIELSIIEAYTRMHLWRFVRYCRSMDELEVSDEARFVSVEAAQSCLWEFANGLKDQELTPFQERRRDLLERISFWDLGKVVKPMGEGSFIFDPTAYALDAEGNPIGRDQQHGARI